MEVAGVLFFCQTFLCSISKFGMNQYFFPILIGSCKKNREMNYLGSKGIENFLGNIIRN